MRKIDLTNFRLATSETARQINRRIALNFIRLSADVARRSGAPVGPAAQHRLGDRRSADRRGLGHRGRRRPVAARTPAAQPAPERRARRHPRRRAAARDHDRRTGRRGRALHGADHVCHGLDPRTVRRRSGGRRVNLRRAHPRVLCEGIGVSLPGRVDDSGRSIFAPNLGWGPVQLTQMLEAAVDCRSTSTTPPTPARSPSSGSAVTPSTSATSSP